MLSIACVLVTEDYWAHPHLGARIAWLETMLLRLSVSELVALEIPVAPIIEKIWTQLTAGVAAGASSVLREEVPRLLAMLRALVPPPAGSVVALA